MNTGNAVMKGYEDVDKEIQSFLARRSVPRQGAMQSATGSSTDILPLLQSLSQTYSEINAFLNSGNAEALKDVILKSDVKMSLVCETLLETLKQTTEEKNRLSSENSSLEKTRRELEEKCARIQIQNERLEQDLQHREDNLSELNRLIRDQKERITEYRAEFNQAKSDFNLQKVKNEELENLRNKGTERLLVYEKEMDAIKMILRERDETIKRLAEEKKLEADKNSGIKARAAELERNLEILNKRLEARDRNLMLCNSELSKVLNENKMMRGDYERFKEGSTYYEGLYNSLSKQNAYLTAQLNRMLKSGEYNKEGMAMFKKYRQRIKKCKRRIGVLEEENRAFKERTEAAKADDTLLTCDTLASRIEELIGENKTHLRKIAELEEGKREIERKIAAIEREKKAGPSLHSLYGRDAPPREAATVRAPRSSRDLGPSRDGYNAQAGIPHWREAPSKFDYTREAKTDGTLESRTRGLNPSEYRGFTDGRALPAADSFPERKNGSFKNNEAPPRQDYFTDYASDRPMNYYLAREAKPFNEIFSSPSFMAPLMPELRKSVSYPKPNLENDYGEDAPRVVLGGFEENNDANKSLFGEEGSHPDAAVLANGLTAGANPVVAGSLPMKASQLSLQASSGTRPKPGPKTPRKPRQAPEANSSESIKTYHTTSTLKDMIARTDNLQKRFESLEEQLANIKEDDSESRLKSKIKTYNTQFSEIGIDSNDSDFI